MFKLLEQLPFHQIKKKTDINERFVIQKMRIFFPSATVK